MLIFGDNGSGKSTILDGVEFAIQARVGRSQRVAPENGPSLISLAVPELPAVSVVLSDGSECRRGIVRNADETLTIDSLRVRDDFALAPIGIKRSDIVRFLDRPVAERAMVFSDYFSRTRGEAGTLAEDASMLLRDRRAVAKAERRGVMTELAALLHVTAVPLDAQNYQVFRKTHLYRGIDPDEARARGFRVSTARPDAVVAALFERIDALGKVIATLNREESALGKPKSIGLANIRGSFEAISQEITASFLEITGAVHVSSIEVRYGDLTPMSLEVRVQLANGRTTTPQQAFSEGYQDLLSLLFFFAVLKEASKHGQARVMLLDDVLQSVDSTVRVGVMRYVLREFKDWQMLITVHDRLWRELLRDLFRQAGVTLVELELRRWQFERGPFQISPGTILDGLASALENGVPASICAEAGRLMELVADRLSWTLGSSVVRRRDDKYTLGDTWPSVRKILRGSSIEAYASRVNELLVLRNLAGAHYNEWANTLSDTEAADFGLAVRAFVGQLYCDSCRQITGAEGAALQCRCGARRVTLSR